MMSAVKKIPTILERKQTLRRWSAACELCWTSRQSRQQLTIHLATLEARLAIQPAQNLTHTLTHTPHLWSVGAAFRFPVAGNQLPTGAPALLEMKNRTWYFHIRGTRNCYL